MTYGMSYTVCHIRSMSSAECKFKSHWQPPLGQTVPDSLLGSTSNYAFLSDTFVSVLVSIQSALFDKLSSTIK